MESQTTRVNASGRSKIKELQRSWCKRLSWSMVGMKSAYHALVTTRRSQTTTSQPIHSFAHWKDAWKGYQETIKVDMENVYVRILDEELGKTMKLSGMCLTIQL